MPEKLIEIQAIYATYAHDEKNRYCCRCGTHRQAVSNDDQGYIIRLGVAVIPVSGVIGKKMNMFSQIPGGVSMQSIVRDIEAALSDSNVNSITH